MRKNNLFDRIYLNYYGFVLSRSLDLVRNELYTYPKVPGMEELESIREDFNRLKEYWIQGYPDDNRQKIYEQLLARTQRLVANVERGITLYGNMPVNLYVKEKLNVLDRLRDPDVMKEKLEHFVTELAMIDLLPANRQKAKEAEVLKEKFNFLEWIYDAIMLSPQWSEDEAQKMEEIFLSPLIDSFSQQALLPAVILGCCTWFDYKKERMLINLYMKSEDEQIKQRALVGLAIAMDSQQYRIADANHENPIEKLMENERTVKELRDLQLQLAMQQQAEKDKDILDKEIIPSIINNAPFSFKNGRFEELEEDPEESILDPEAAERRQENMDNTMDAMRNYLKLGRDIHYGNCMHMKKYPFFDRALNWTLPYTPKHPTVMEGLRDSRVGDILASSAQLSQLCDSDCYSFLLTLKSSMPKMQMPEDMLESLHSSMQMQYIGYERRNKKPMLIRRNLIQNIYRLVKLKPDHTMFPDLFDDKDDKGNWKPMMPYLFFMQPVFIDTELVRKWGAPVAMLLNGRGKTSDANTIMISYDKMEHTFESACFMASISGAIPGGPEKYLREALTFKRDDGVIAKLARLYTNNSMNRKEGMELLEELLERNPNNIEALKIKGMALAQVAGEQEAAKALLYRVNYEKPDDLEVCKSLGNLLFGMGNAEQACSLLEKVYNNGKCEDYEHVQYGLVLFASHRIREAVEVLRPLDNDMVVEYIRINRNALNACGVTAFELELFKASLEGKDY